MSILKSLILGAVQGLTEFLPVSSSGHLVLLQKWFGLEGPQGFFDVMLHLATTFAVIWMFRHELAGLVRNGFTQTRTSLQTNPSSFFTPTGSVRYILLLFLGTCVTGVIGLKFEGWFESMFSNPTGVGIALLITGGLLLLTLRAKEHGQISSIDALTWWRVVVIGAAQGAALMPGLSRSGTTIVAALLLGLDRRLAVEFSFLLSIPVILGVAVKKMLSIPEAVSMATVLPGMLVAFIVGYFCLFLLKLLVKRGRLYLFAFYCIPLGVVVLFLTWIVS